MRTELPDGCYHIRSYLGDYWHCRDGGLHRTDGPALIRPDGVCGYYKNDELHRLDGPAYTWRNGDVEYFVNGKIPKTILDIVIIQEDIDYESFPSAELITNYIDAAEVGNRAYRIVDPDELLLAILRYG